eukprot:6749-Amphidinium_carterae.1
MIVMGAAAADLKLLKANAEAHRKAIGSVSGPNGMTSQADWENVEASLGRVIASVPESTCPRSQSTCVADMVNGVDAERAYEGFLAVRDVVKKSQVTLAAKPPTCS